VATPSAEIDPQFTEAIVVVQALSEYTLMLGEEVVIDPDEFMFALTLISL